MIQSKLLLLVGILMMLGAPGSGWAHPVEEGQPGVVGARFREVRAKVLREKVGLDEKTASRAEEVMNQFDARRIELRKSVRRHTRALNELVRSNSDDQKAYQEVLDGLNIAQRDLESLRRQELEGLSKVLTPKEQARVLVEMRETRRLARQMVRERRSEMPRRPPPGGLEEDLDGPADPF